MKVFAISALVAIVIGGCIYLEVGVWNECRQTNSWFYCMRILGR